MHSNPNNRRRDRGFTFLEALVSIAIVALAMGAVMVTLSRVSNEQRVRFDRLQLTEFAASKLEEWSVGGVAATDPKGTIAGGWNWNISEIALDPVEPSTMDASMYLARVTIGVWKEGGERNPVGLSTVVARRR